MEGKRSIHFELLGSFTYGSGEGGEAVKQESAPKAGRKTLSFLQYLIVNHNRNISSEELIERFWRTAEAPGRQMRCGICCLRSGSF
jgi:DNA-binding SARP family transcriptional activator